MTANNRGRVHHSTRSDGSDDLFFQLNDGTLRLFDRTIDPTPIYRLGDEKNKIQFVDENIESIDNETGQEFAFEKDLLNFLSKNLNVIEPGLVLFEKEGLKGIEFNAGGRFIDILALDKNKNFVVIELKVSKGSDKVVGQLLRYIGWIKSNIADQNQMIRGIIIARNISDDLRIACSVVQNVMLFEYNISFTLKAIDTL
jgi:RecB family endonuclease NucS